MLNYNRSRYCFFISTVIIFLFPLAILPSFSKEKDTQLHSKILDKQYFNILNKQKASSNKKKIQRENYVFILQTFNKIKYIKIEVIKFYYLSKKLISKLYQLTKFLFTVKNVFNKNEIQKVSKIFFFNQLKFQKKIIQLLHFFQNIKNDVSKNNNQFSLLHVLLRQKQNIFYEKLRKNLNKFTNLIVCKVLNYSQKTSILIEKISSNLRIKQLNSSLLLNDFFRNIIQTQFDGIIKNIDFFKNQSQFLQKFINKKNFYLNEQSIQKIVLQNTISSIQNNILIRQELEINYEIKNHLIRTIKNENALIQQNIKIKNWLNRALQSEKNIKEQIEMLKGNLLLSRILYQQQQTLPSADELIDITNLIANLRFEQFKINQQRDTLFNNDFYISKIENKQKNKINNAVHNILVQIINERRKLLDTLNKRINNQLSIAINLQINQQKLVNVTKNLHEILTQQIFWINSNKPIDLEWIKFFPESLKTQLYNIKVNIKWEKVWPTITTAFLSGVPLLLIASLIRWSFKWLKNYQNKLANEVGFLRKDTQLHTPKAIIIDLIFQTPVYLIILATGLMLLKIQLSISNLLWVFSKRLAVFWLIFGLCWKILKKDGVAVRHFNISEDITNHWRPKILCISFTLLPLYFWSVSAELSPLYLMDDVFGQLIILLNLFVITIIMWLMCRDVWHDKKSHSIRLITIIILAIVPVTLMILTATGYFYTTLRLAGRWIETVYLVILWNLLYQTVLRGLSVAARRISYRRALTRRQNIVKDNNEGPNPKEESIIALKQVNQQTLRIAILVMLSCFSLIFWAIWSDLITVFAYLDSIILWHYNVTEAGIRVLKNVTMGSLLFAFICILVALALIRNLPGLLEVLILSRLNMRRGMSYAITTILNYIIIAISTMMALSSLGVSWDKLQWLAAALSVGLGFGLQEIFGNFVSGLIILFERPVRIGDTVTIGNFSGTVSKIHIRATTITDFDRKEIIIPNKVFVTERLINWSLSDTTTRVVIKLGVEHGSDLDKVKKILLKAAKEHPKVMHDPAPDVFFTAFGPSTLDHELRLYVRELRDRSYTVDELNRTIDKLCRENGINIAFNQLEIHLHNKQMNNS